MEMEEPKVYAFLYCGMGNRLFQAASAYGIAKRLGRKCVLAPGDQNPHSSKNYFESLLRDFEQFTQMPSKCLNYWEPSHRPCLHNVIPIPEPDQSLCLRGYFNNEKYFLDYREDILRMFGPTDEQRQKLLRRFPLAERSYFIHFRLGDFCSPGIFNLDLRKYYTEATKLAREANPDAHFYVMTNDQSACRDHPHFVFAEKEMGNFTFVTDELDEIETLHLMSLCKYGGIAANSTFSWWGAWLNNNPAKRTYFPSKWFDNDWEIDVQPSDAIVIDP